MLLIAKSTMQVGQAVPPTTGLLLVLALLSAADAINVLILHPLYSGSHERTLRMFGEQMVERGHNVTQIRWLSSKSEREVSSPVQLISRRVNSSHLSSLYFDADGVFLPPTDLLWHGQWGHHGGFSGIKGLHKLQPLQALLPPYLGYSEMSEAHCQDLLGDRQLFQQLRSRGFDIALVDIISNECGLALAAALQLRVVGFWGFSFVGGMSHATSALNLPSVTPTYLSNTGPEMSLIERLYNTYCMMAYKLSLHIQFRNADSYIQDYFPGLPSAAALVKNIDMVLVHSNFLASQPVLLPPNVQMIGCTQCRDPMPLPQDLEEFMRSAGDHGVVVFSLGITGYDPRDVPDDYIDTFINVFGRLKQKVLMRFSASRLGRVPANVKVLEWLPQIDVLGHPQTRVFVSHCGMNGIMEALYGGVPILGVPIFGDQGENAKLLHYRELGIALDKSALTEDLLAGALDKLLYSDKYRENARRTAAVWRMEPESAADRALRWVELVARHGTPRHLQMVDGHLSWYQYWLLDVAAVYAAALAAVVTAAVLTCRCALRRLTALSRRGGAHKLKSQ